MTDFTSNPLERMMKQPPRAYREVMQKLPISSICRDCSYWRGIACIGICYKTLTAPRKAGEKRGKP